jgi:hypothetical protein
MLAGVVDPVICIRSRWRSRSAGQITVLVLAVLRHDQRAADLDGGNQVSATTIRRWTDEVIALLAAKAPCLDRALKKIARRGAASEVKTASRRLTNIRAARIGPTVCELYGPMPIENRSKTLTAMLGASHAFVLREKRRNADLPRGSTGGGRHSVLAAVQCPAPLLLR